MNFILPLHRLAGGVCKLQALGNARARVWLMAMPRLEPPPLTKTQRHWGLDWTTLDSAVQQDEDGVDEFPLT